MVRILFVCTGNTCRSPMAEAILTNKNIDNIEVKSAGIFAMDGSPASHNAQKVLKEEKIEYDHQAKMLTEDLVNWATYIFTMTNNHKRTILDMFPTSSGKTFTLKEFAEENNSGDISDPFGGSLDVYRHTYVEIRTYIEKAIKQLEKKGAIQED